MKVLNIYSLLLLLIIIVVSITLQYKLNILERFINPEVQNIKDKGLDYGVINTSIYTSNKDIDILEKKYKDYQNFPQIIEGKLSTGNSNVRNLENQLQTLKRIKPIEYNESIYLSVYPSTYRRRVRYGRRFCRGPWWRRRCYYKTRIVQRKYKYSNYVFNKNNFNNKNKISEKHITIKPNGNSTDRYVRHGDLIKIFDSEGNQLFADKNIKIIGNSNKTRNKDIIDYNTYVYLIEQKPNRNDKTNNKLRMNNNKTATFQNRWFYFKTRFRLSR